MTHPLVTQLRFARSEFVRCLEGVSDGLIDHEHCFKRGEGKDLPCTSVPFT